MNKVEQKIVVMALGQYITEGNELLNKITKENKTLESCIEIFLKWNKSLQKIFYHHDKLQHLYHDITKIIDWTKISTTKKNKILQNEVTRNLELINKAISEIQGHIGSKIKIFIDKDKGIYIDSTRIYKLMDNSKRMTIVKDLLTGKKTGKQLIGSANRTIQLLSNEIREINKNFRNKVMPTYDLIINTNNAYKLNDEKFEIDPVNV